MHKTDSDKIKAITHKVGLKHNLLDAEVTSIIASPYKFTKEVIVGLDVPAHLTEEEFNNLKTNFIYMYLGKLYASYGLYARLKSNKNNGSIKESSSEEEREELI